MSYDASPPIISKYTRQTNLNSRPRTSGASRVTDDLDESSLAAWWNIDKTINLNNNTTPFRKQRYEPIKWANAHLLLEEDGAEFLADDPFATPAPALKSAKKPSSARKRNSNAAAGYPRSSSRGSVGSHRDLTLADLTPRSRRLSSFRTKTPQRSRTSEPNVRPLRLSFNGPAFAPNPHHDLEMIQEHGSQQFISPLLPAFRPLTPERALVSQLSPATPQRIHQRQVDDPHAKTLTPMRTPTRQSRPSETQIAVENTKQKRKSGRPSIPSTGLSQPTQALEREGSDDDNEELHKSIPGAFDFVASERFQPQLPKTVLQEPKPPRRSNTMDGMKPRSTGRPSEATMKRAVTVPGTSNSGLAGILVEYGNSLMELLGPNPNQPPARQISGSLKPSDLSSGKPAGSRQSNANESTRTTSKPIVPRAAIPRNPAMPSPVKMNSINKAPTTVPPSRLQKPSQAQFPSVRSTDNLAQPARAAMKVTGRPNIQPTTLEAVRRPPSQQPKAGSLPRSRSRSRPPSTVHEELPIQVSEPTTILAPRSISTEAVKLVRQPRTSAGTSNIVLRTSPLPSPLKMLVDRSPIVRPVARPSPGKSRPSTLHTMAVAPEPVTVAVTLPKPSHRALKPILKKRSLEVSPAKVGLEERAKKRQKLTEVSARERSKEKEIIVPAERGATEGERGRNALGRRGKMEQAPRKQVARSRSRAPSEVPALVLPNIGAGSPSIHKHRSRSRSQDIGNRSRSQSRLGQRIMDLQDHVMMYTAAHGSSPRLEEDVFGTVVENSLEVVNAATETPRYSPPAPQHILESMSPIQRPREHISIPQPPPEGRRAYDHQPTRPISHALQPSTAYNSPKRTRPPVTVTQKAASPVRIDYRPQMVEYFPEDYFVPRPQHHDRDDGDCRLTIPVSPKFMRGHREKEREERLLERERERERERPMKPILQHKERSTRITQRGMPPVAAALLAKLAGFEADLTSRRPRDKSAQTATHKFTFRLDLRPTLGRDGAVLVDRAIRQQFESTRNLWEQRSLEASLESRADSLNRSRSRSRGASAQQAKPVGRYTLPTASTSARAVAREARRDVRRREGGKQREERGEKLERVPAWNRPSEARENRPW